MKMDADDSRTATIVADLWHFYDEHAAQARQHESLRATVTSTLAAIAGAIGALAGVGGFTRSDIPAGALVVVISCLGVALSLKHFERNRWHITLMRQTQREIEQLRLRGLHIPTREEVRLMDQIWDDAKKEHNANFSTARKPKREGNSPWVRWRLYRMWIGLPLLIGGFGVLVMLLGWWGVGSGGGTANECTNCLFQINE
jgi:hypothetical protein